MSIIMQNITMMYIWMLILLQRFIDTVVIGLMCIHDKWFIIRSSPPYVVSNVLLDNRPCINRFNFLLWLYWDKDIPGISLVHVNMLRGEMLSIITKSMVINIDLVNQKYCDGDDILFNELVLV